MPVRLTRSTFFQGATLVSILLTAAVAGHLRLRKPVPPAAAPSAPAAAADAGADHRVLEDRSIRPRPHLTEGGQTEIKQIVRRQLELRFYAEDGTFMRATFEQFLDASEGEEIAGVWVDK